MSASALQHPAVRHRGMLYNGHFLQHSKPALSFAVVAARIFWGEMVLPTTAPLPFFAYRVLILTFVGWIATLLKRA